MTDLELWVAIFFAVNTFTIVGLTMIIDHRITKLETKIRSLRWR